MTFAWIALTSGEIEQAFAWLDRAYEDRNPLLLQIGVAPRYDPLRRDARFAALLGKVGLDGVTPAARPGALLDGVERSRSTGGGDWM
jgi:hypothetical protein